jgi:lactate permease
VALAAFTQELHPAGGVTGSTLLALVPVFTMLVALAVLRVTAWLAVIIGSVATILLALFVWDVPTRDTFRSCLYGTAIGAWAVAWIVLWGVVLYNTMVVTGSFDRLKEWLIQQATRDIRIQTILLAWAFGALLEGLVGFGYPWAVVAPILIALGVVEIEGAPRERDREQRARLLRRPRGADDRAVQGDQDRHHVVSRRAAGRRDTS